MSCQDLAEGLGANQPDDLTWQLLCLKALYQPTIPTLGETVTLSRSASTAPYLILTISSYNDYNCDFVHVIDICSY